MEGRKKKRKGIKEGNRMRVERQGGERTEREGIPPSKILNTPMLRGYASNRSATTTKRNNSRWANSDTR